MEGILSISLHKYFQFPHSGIRITSPTLHDVTEWVCNLSFYYASQAQFLKGLFRAWFWQAYSWTSDWAEDHQVIWIHLQPIQVLLQSCTNLLTFTNTYVCKVRKSDHMSSGLSNLCSLLFAMYKHLVCCQYWLSLSESHKSLVSGYLCNLFPIMFMFLCR